MRKMKSSKQNYSVMSIGNVQNETNNKDFHSDKLTDVDKICVFYPIKLADVDQACARYSIGRNTMRELAEQAGAVVRIKRLWKVNIPVMDAYFDSITE